MSVQKSDGPPLKYGEKGGKLFRQFPAAEAHAEKHNKAGRDAIILYSDLNWKDPYVDRAKQR